MSTPLASLKVSWLLAQKRLELIPHVPTDAEFTVVYPSELRDPREFLSPGGAAVVLTLGLAFEEDPESFEDYVIRLKAAGCAAIGFGTGLCFPTVPKSLINAATKHHIGLFEVPRKIPFLSILATVHGEFSRQLTRTQDRLLALQEELNKAAIHGGLEELLHRTSTVLESAVAVIDNDGRIHASADYQQLSAVDTARRAVATGRGLSRAEINAVIHRMASQGERHHIFVVVHHAPLHAQARALIKHSAGLADILLQRPSYLRKARSELNTLALSLLLGIGGQDQAISSALHSVTDSRGELRPMVVQADDARRLQKTLSTIDERLGDHGRTFFALPLDETTALVVLRGTRGVQECAAHCGDHRSRLRIAVGAPVLWNQLSLQSVEELRTVAAATPRGDTSGPRTHGAKWLKDPVVQDILRRRTEEVLGRLRSHDRETGEELCDTLVAYVRAGGSMGLAAEQLGVHRHTMRSRVAKISRLIEVDIDDPLTRAELLLVVVANAPTSGTSG